MDPLIREHSTQNMKVLASKLSRQSSLNLSRQTSINSLQRESSVTKFPNDNLQHDPFLNRFPREASFNHNDTIIDQLKHHNIEINNNDHSLLNHIHTIHVE